jgi:hypothetical protein
MVLAFALQLEEKSSSPFISYNSSFGCMGLECDIPDGCFCNFGGVALFMVYSIAS